MASQRVNDIRAAIIRAANEDGVDPAYALAVAERESGFNPTARNSKTIAGMYQMTGNLRNQYGSGDSLDPYAQAKGWTAFIKDTKGQMQSRLGRPVTDDETYLAHHFGAGRASAMLAGQDVPVSSVFNQNELDLNPHIGRAGSTGRLVASTLADIGNRRARHSDALPDFSAYGEAVDGGNGGDQAAKAPDLAQYGTPAQAPDLSSMGTPA